MAARCFSIRLVFAIAILGGSAPAADAAGSFVYLLGQVCSSSTSCAPVEQVYDAGTGGLVLEFFGATGTTPAGIAISSDGRRIYASYAPASGSPLVSVLDGSTHTVLASMTTAEAGKLAVSRDGTRLFVLALRTLYVYDTSTGALVATVSAASNEQSLLGVAANPVSDRFYIVSLALSANPQGVLREYDISTGTPVVGRMLTSLYNWQDVHVSADGSRLYATASFNQSSPSSGGAVTVIDPVGWQVIQELKPPGYSPLGTIDSLARARMYTWFAYQLTVFDRDTFGSVETTSAKIPVGMAITADQSRAYLATRFDAASQVGANALSSMDLATNTIDRTLALSGAPVGVVATPPNAASDVCGYRVDTHQLSFPSSISSGQVSLTTTCAWQASIPDGWARVPRLQTYGAGSATVIVTVDANFSGSSRSTTLTIGGQVVTITQAGLVSSPPFGVFDTPASGSGGLSGAISVSGWALDDVGVARVRILRDPVGGETAGAQVYIGDATFVDGARPDVQALYPTLPFASRAGWGLQVLTNVLPNQGDGTYRLYAYADDVEGHTTLLGASTIACSNASAAQPFGTIDTPGQGETVAGSIVNFGWVLSPAAIPTDGSTISVLVDGAIIGRPVYNNFRSDIAALFPGYPNSGGAVGYFVIDTTTLSNGLHSIAWVVTDSAGRTQGIGSRFFNVGNP